VLPVLNRLTPFKPTGKVQLMNRETWLANFASAARPHITATIGGYGANEEAAIRLSCGFPPATGRKAATAAIVPPAASDDFTAEVFIAPTVDDARAVAAALLPLLKLAHAGTWRTAAPSVAKPLETLPTWASTILETLGEYPHAKLEIAAAPKQTTRLIKAVCYGDLMNGEAHAAYIVRMSRNTADTLGAPICPVCSSRLNVEA
jgi:hypothetical protein